jgi:hypothetical protein
MNNAVSVGIGVALRWVLLYGPLVFLTQLWAGTQYSPGQGGGWRELTLWAVAFGLVTTTACVERAINGTRVVDPGAVLKVAVAGHVAGSAVAVWWFTTKGGPGLRDWWVAPAVAAGFVVVWVHLLAARLPREGE